MKTGKKVSRGFVMNRPGGLGEIIEGNAEGLQAVKDDRIISIHHLFWCDAGFIGSQRYRHPMIICTTDMQNVMALKALVSNVNIAGEVRTGDMAEMQLAIGIRQCIGNKIFFLCHGIPGKQYIHRTSNLAH